MGRHEPFGLDPTGKTFTLKGAMFIVVGWRTRHALPQLLRHCWAARAAWNRTAPERHEGHDLSGVDARSEAGDVPLPILLDQRNDEGA